MKKSIQKRISRLTALVLTLLMLALPLFSVFADGTTIANEKFYKKLLSVAKEENIKAQTKAAIAGGNDAGAIHIAQGGIKCATVSVPCRYIHSPAGIASKADINAVKELAGAFLRRIDEFID